MSTLVVDASVVVAALVGSTADADRALDAIAGARLLAPHLLPFEVDNVIRRQAVAGLIDSTTASLAHAGLMSLPVRLVPHRPLAQRVWELRDNLSAYDAAYVALAEFSDCALITLDARLSRAPGVRCEIVVP